jgi:lipoteichoic acid synthase
MKRSLNMMVIAFIYLFFLRIILAFTIPIKLFNVGLFFDGIILCFFMFIMMKIFRSARSQKIFYAVFLLFWTTLTVANSIYYTYFYTLVSRSSLQGLSVMSAGLTQEYDLQIPIYFWLLFLVNIAVIVLIAKQKRADYFFKSDYFVLVFITLLQVVILFSFYHPKEEATLEYYQSDAYLYHAMHDRVTFTEKYGYYYYHIVDLFRPIPIIDEESFLTEITEFFNQQEPHTQNDYSGLFEDYNLVKITVESLDTRFIHPTISPTLYKMMHEGYHFDQVYVPVFQQGATCNSEFMATTGLMAINSNDFSNNICDAYDENSFPYALPNQLNDIGYQTYYFHSGHNWFYNRENIIPQLGFQTVKFQEDLIEIGHTTFTDRLDTNLMLFVDEYVDLNERFFIQFLTYSLHGAYNHKDFVHHDYLVTEAYGEDLDSEIRVYLQKLAEFDLFLTMLVEALINANVYDETLFVIYTDHYPYMLNPDTFSEFLGVTYDSAELYHQSLIMYNSQMQPTVFSTVGATIDITPTILNLISPNAEFKYFFGKDLTSETEGFALLQDLSIVDKDNRYYLNKPYTGDPSKEEALQDALVKYITIFELQKKLLNIDYFSHLSE